MLSTVTSLRRVYKALTREQKKSVFLVQFMMLLTAFFELLNISLIAGFVAIISAPDFGIVNKYTKELFIISSAEELSNLILYSSILIFCVLLFTTLFSIVTVWRMSSVSNSIGAEFSSRLMGYYISRPWEFHAATNSSELMRKISSETKRLTTNVLLPSLNLVAKFFLILLVSAALIMLDPLVAGLGIAILGMSYIAVFLLIKRRLIVNGRMLSTIESKRLKMINESIGGIREIILRYRQNRHVEDFEITSGKMSRMLAVNNTLALAPKYILELIVLGSFLILVSFWLVVEGSEFYLFLPYLASYALAGLRLLPASQVVYSSLSLIEANIAAFDDIEEDLKASFEPVNSSEELNYKLEFKEAISFHNISFTYAGASEPVLKDFDTRIKKGEFFGVIGASGAGKSTLIDILLGFYEPTQGELCLDGRPITGETLRAWRSEIGYVPQTISFIDGSIAENVAIGLRSDEIDYTRVEEVLGLAGLTNYISRLPANVKSVVGEDGVRISGGQRQRIGIARALYNNPSILILDEATSSLDTDSEKKIVDLVTKLVGDITIISVAHRVSTLSNCDKVIMLRNGSVHAEGPLSKVLGDQT